MEENLFSRRVVQVPTERRVSIRGSCQGSFDKAMAYCWRQSSSEWDMGQDISKDPFPPTLLKSWARSDP